MRFSLSAATSASCRMSPERLVFDQNGRGLHQADQAVVDHALVFLGQSGVQADEIGLGKYFFEGCRDTAGGFDARGVRVGVVDQILGSQP